MKDMLKNLLGSSPRTTIMGFIQAVLLGIIPLVQKDGFDLKTDWIWLLLAAGRAVAGRLQKDSNGITASEAKAVIKPEIPKQ